MYGRAEGIADHYWPWAVVFPLTELYGSLHPLKLISYRISFMFLLNHILSFLFVFYYSGSLLEVWRSTEGAEILVVQ